MKQGLWLVALVCLGVAVSAQTRFRAAEYQAGPVPVLPPLTVGGGEVFLELAVTKAGAVSDVKTLRTTPPFTATFAAAARAWRFRPAEQLTESRDGSRPPAWEPVDATVLFAAIVRPPTLNTPTLGQLPRDIGSEADDTPFPLDAITPLFPLRARDDGAVLVQVAVDAAGRVTNAKILQASPGFNDEALGAARAWTFRPARVRGEAVATYAYLAFIFRQPVTPLTITPGGPVMTPAGK